MNEEIFKSYKFSCIIDLRIFCLKRGRPWLEFWIKFNRCNIRCFPRALVRLITFEFISFLESLIECSCLKYLVHPSKWRTELDTWEAILFSVPEEIVYSSNFHFNIFGIVYIWPMYHSLDKRVWFTIIFLSLKECLTQLLQLWIFLSYLH